MELPTAVVGKAALNNTQVNELCSNKPSFRKTCEGRIWPGGHNLLTSSSEHASLFDDANAADDEAAAAAAAGDNSDG